MKTVIWEYILAITEVQKIQVPSGAVPLSVCEKNRELCLWFFTYPEKRANEYLNIYIYGAGHIIENLYSLNFIGTVVTFNGLVWHVFYEKEYTSLKSSF